MNEIESDLNNSLMRFNFILKNEEFYMDCVKNLDTISVLGKNFGPFEKRKKYKMKLFEAVPFIDANVLIISDKEKCDNVTVQGYAIAEKDENRLVRRDNNLILNKIREFKKFMEKAIRDATKPHDFLNKYSADLTFLIDSRLNKLLLLSKTDISMDDESRLTSSERYFYKQVNKMIKIWRKFFLSFN